LAKPDTAWPNPLAHREPRTIGSARFAIGLAYEARSRP